METKHQLFIAKEKEYGDQYKDHLFEQYKLFVESAEKISDRRQHANNYFITINATLISFIGLSFQIKNLQDIGWVRILIVMVGVATCIIFWYLLRSYKQINSGKFKVIHEIEQHLPIALYDYEWEVLGRGDKPKLYYPFSHIELKIPWIFGILYVLLGVFLFISSLGDPHSPSPPRSIP